MPAADIYITVSDYFCDVVPAILLKKRHSKARWIAWIHHRELHPSVRPGNWLVNSVAWWIQEWSFKRISQFADQAWVLDSAAGDLVSCRLNQLGMANDRIVKMKNGVDAASLRGIPEQQKEFDAVMIGVRPNKGLHDIVPIWRNVQEIRPGTTLLLIGGMTGVSSLKREINAAGLDDCIHIEQSENGFVPFNEFFSKVKKSRVLFAPSHEEGWGIAHCEAMVCGLPVVAYDLPVYERVFRNSLLTVKESDHKAFAKAVCSVLDDKVLFKQYRDRGVEIAGGYDWDRISEDDWLHIL